MDLFEKCVNFEKLGVGYTHPLAKMWEAILIELKTIVAVIDAESDPSKLLPRMRELRGLSGEGIKLLEEVAKIHRKP